MFHPNHSLFYILLKACHISSNLPLGDLGQWRLLSPLLELAQQGMEANKSQPYYKQCCGSKYIEFVYVSRILAQFGSRVTYVVFLNVKNSSEGKKNLVLKNYRKIIAPEEICSQLSLWTMNFRLLRGSKLDLESDPDSQHSLPYKTLFFIGFMIILSESSKMYWWNEWHSVC